MKRNTKLFTAASLFVSFVLWTAMLFFVDVQAIGPQNSEVGLATLNHAFHAWTGVHWQLYTLTDWLGLVPVGFGFAFALLGLRQWIRRKSILRVDFSLFVLGGFYLAVLAAYLFFEQFVVNYRPVEINGIMEVSYPSSTTLLVLCVLPTALLQLRTRIACPLIRRCVTVLILAFLLFSAIRRFRK